MDPLASLKARNQTWVLGLGFRLEVLGFRVLGVRVWDLGFRC